jgi:hypothetical protein
MFKNSWAGPGEQSLRGNYFHLPQLVATTLIKKKKMKASVGDKEKKLKSPRQKASVIIML